MNASATVLSFGGDPGAVVPLVVPSPAGPSPVGLKSLTWLFRSPAFRAGAARVRDEVAKALYQEARIANSHHVALRADTEAQKAYGLKHFTDEEAFTHFSSWPAKFAAVQ